MNKPVAQLELIKAEPTSRVEPKAYADTPAENDGVQPFSWEHDDEDIILEEQPRTAVYENRSGAVVILQESTGVYDDDQIVRIRPENVPALIKALKGYVR
jgi:hypothetical protein